VDTDNGIVRFLETKTHTARAVPLIGEALRVIRMLRQTDQSTHDWVFPGLNGKAPRFFDQSWRIARRNACITNFRFHDLRHTYASYLAMSGASLRDIAELLGHTKIQMSMIYSHLCESHTAPIVAKMAQQFLQPPQKPEGDTPA
jgi:integrase